MLRRFFKSSSHRTQSDAVSDSGMPSGLCLNFMLSHFCLLLYTLFIFIDLPSYYDPETYPEVPTGSSGLAVVQFQMFDDLDLRLSDELDEVFLIRAVLSPRPLLFTSLLLNDLLLPLCTTLIYI